MGRKNHIELMATMTHADALQLRRQLTRAGFEAEVYRENPITPADIQNHLVVVLDGTLATVAAGAVQWAVGKCRDLRAERSKRRAEITLGAGDAPLKITASKEGVHVSGTLLPPEAAPRAGLKTKKPKRAKTSKRAKKKKRKTVKR